MKRLPPWLDSHVDVGPKLTLFDGHVARNKGMRVEKQPFPAAWENGEDGA